MKQESNGEDRQQEEARKEKTFYTNLEDTYFLYTPVPYITIPANSMKIGLVEVEIVLVGLTEILNEHEIKNNSRTCSPARVG